MTAPAQTMDPTEVLVGTANDVGLWIAPEGTACPPAGAPFTDPWKPLGYASDDGPTLSGDTTSEALTPWQSRTPIRTIITERKQTVQFVLWQLNQYTLGLYFDADVPEPGEDGAIEFDVRSDAPSHIHAIAIDGKDGEAQFRVSYKRATLDSVGDLQLQKGAAVPLDVTLSALDDSGVLCSVYVKPGSASEGAVAATGATSGTPGAFTPAGASVPANLAALQGASIAASPSTAWATGESVKLGDASDAHWDASAWVAGVAP